MYWLPSVCRILTATIVIFRRVFFFVLLPRPANGGLELANPNRLVYDANGMNYR